MEAANNWLTSAPLSRVANIMAWANRANGGLLLATGLFGLFGAFSQVRADMLTSALLSVYVGGFGALLLRYELAAGPEMRSDYGFMYTYVGRAAFLFLIGNLAWTCDPLGFVAAVLTNANALLSAYVMWQHPSFQQGHASATAIGGFDDQGTELIYTGGSSTAPIHDDGRGGGAFEDASSAAARMRDAVAY